MMQIGKNLKLAFGIFKKINIRLFVPQSWMDPLIMDHTQIKFLKENICLLFQRFYKSHKWKKCKEVQAFH